MIQQPQLCYPQPKAQEAQYNAVKIDIHNPEVNAPGAQKPNKIQAPIYHYPQSSVYMPNTQTPVLPQAVRPQVPEKKSKVANAESKMAQADQAVKLADKAVKEAAEAVDKVGEPKKSVEPTVAKPADEPKSIAPVPVAQAMNAINPAEHTEKLKKAMDTPAQLEDAIKQIASLAQKDKTTAIQLQSPRLIEQLITVTKQDTSKFAGPTPEQIDLRQKEKTNQTLTDDQKKLANKFSDLETAERNKQYAFYTIAMLNKAILDQVKASGKTLKEDQIPAFNEMKDALKANPNPAVREAAAAAIEYFATPEYKTAIEPFMQLAAKDENPKVKERAEKVLKKLG